jgi:hypothetical protein
MAQGAVLSNLDGIVFNKGYMYGTIEGHGSDLIAFGALQNVAINHAFTFAELDGPESLSPLGVGLKSETLDGSWEYGVVTPEQFVMAMGGHETYNAGTAHTTYTKLVNEEPSPFNLHFTSAPANPDMEVFLYRCLSNTWNVVRADNRGWVMGSGNFRCYGQAIADGGKLFEIIKPGDLTNAS